MKTLNWRTIFLRLLSLSAYFVLPASFQLVNSLLGEEGEKRKKREEILESESSAAHDGPTRNYNWTQ